MAEVTVETPPLQNNALLETKIPDEAFPLLNEPPESYAVFALVSKNENESLLLLF